VHDVGALVAHDLHRLKKIPQAAQRTETAAPALDRDHGKSFGLEPLAILAHARRHRDLQAAIPRRLRHRQEMRDKKPVFGVMQRILGMIGGGAILACSAAAGIPQSRPPVLTCAIRLAEHKAGEAGGGRPDSV
jgi:hypothetical protein